MWIIASLKHLTQTIVGATAVQVDDDTTFAQVAEQLLHMCSQIQQDELRSQPFTVAGYKDSNHCNKATAAVGDPVASLSSNGYKDIVLHCVPEAVRPSVPQAADPPKQPSLGGVQCLPTKYLALSTFKGSVLSFELQLFNDLVDHCCANQFL